MTKRTLLARPVAALAALVVAGSAAGQSQGAITPEVGIGWLSGKWVERDTYRHGGHSLALNAAIGWQNASGFGVRAMVIADLQPFRGLWGENDKSFDDFLGVQATGSMALAPAWNLKGGVGVGSTRLDQGPDGSAHTLTDGALSLGLQWHPGTHYAMELRVDHLTRSDVTSAGIQFQWPF